MYMYMFLMRDEKEERKKQARSNKQTRQSNTARPRQSLFLRKMSCLGWDSNPRHSCTCALVLTHIGVRRDCGGKKTVCVRFSPHSSPHTPLPLPTPLPPLLSSLSHTHSLDTFSDSVLKFKANAVVELENGEDDTPYDEEKEGTVRFCFQRPEDLCSILVILYV